MTPKELGAVYQELTHSKRMFEAVEDEIQRLQLLRTHLAGRITELQQTIALETLLPSRPSYLKE